MNVLIIPEDFRKDQYIVEPVIRRMLSEVGKPTARVRVCRDPLMGGVAAAMNWTRVKEVLDRYRGMVDLFLLLVDRDGNEGRRVALTRLEESASSELPSGRTLIGENAWQEIEVWALAGQELPKDWSWNAIVEEVHVKESYFEPLAQLRGLTKEPGGGRKTMGVEAARNYSRVRSRCRNDVSILEGRIKAWIESK
jgi:hypothetical protein